MHGFSCTLLMSWLHNKCMLVHLTFEALTKSETIWILKCAISSKTRLWALSSMNKIHKSWRIYFSFTLYIYIAYSKKFILNFFS